MKSLLNNFTKDHLLQFTGITIAIAIAYLMTQVSARAHPGTVALMGIVATIAAIGPGKFFNHKNVPLLIVTMVLTLLGLYVYHIQDMQDNGVKNATTVPLIMAVAILTSMRTKANRLFLKALPYLAILGLVITASEIAYDYFMQSYAQDSRLAGNLWIGDANASNAAALAFGLIAFFSFKDRSVKTLIALLAMLVFAGAQSRSAFAALVLTGVTLGTFYLCVTVFKNKTKTWARLAGIIALVAPLVTLGVLIEASKLLPPNISVISRISIIESTFEMVQANVKEDPKKLLFGNGFSTWRENYTQFRQKDDINSAGITVHFDYLEYLYEAGLPFTLLFAGMLGMTASALLRKAKQSGLLFGLAASTVYISGFAVFNFAFIAPIFDVLVGIAVGVALNCGRAAKANNIRIALRLIGGSIALFLVISAKFSLMLFMVTAKAPPFIPTQTWDNWTVAVTNELAQEKSFLANTLMASYSEKQAFELTAKGPEFKDQARASAENAASYYYIADHILPICNDCNLKVASIIDAFTEADEVSSKKKALEFGYKALEVNKTDSGVYYLIGRLELSLNNNIEAAEKMFEMCVTNTVSASYLDGLRCAELGGKILAARKNAPLAANQ